MHCSGSDLPPPHDAEGVRNRLIVTSAAGLQAHPDAHRGRSNLPWLGAPRRRMTSSSAATDADEEVSSGPGALGLTLVRTVLALDENALQETSATREKTSRVGDPAKRAADHGS